MYAYARTKHYIRPLLITLNTTIMKKLLLSLVAVIAIAISFASCKKDSPTPSSFSMEQLYGTWRITKVEQKDGSMLDVTSAIAQLVFPATYATFDKDGKYQGRGYFGKGEGTYKVSGNTIICYIDGAEYARYEVLSISGDTAILRASISGESVKIECKKQ
nr:MAG TPA: lipocalin-like protein [Caudoviricetes sp.]